MTIETCPSCSLGIDDYESDSICCDICNRWFHASKSCSGLKKSLFNNIKKNDQWACPICIKYYHSLKNGNVDSTIRGYVSEITNLKNERCKLVEEINALARLAERDREMEELSRMVVSTGEVVGGRGGEWTVVAGGGRGSGGRTAVDRVDVALQTSNSFEVLVDVGDLSMEDFPPLEARRKGDSGSRGDGKFVRGVGVVGDSHGRRCRGRLKACLGSEVEVMTKVMPGKPMSHLIDCASESDKGAADSDLLVIVGGTNGVTENSISDLGTKIDRCLKNKKRYVLWVEAPYRQNELIKTKCLENQWDFLSINSILDRNCYTKHGLHLNAVGKDVLCGIITTFFHAMDKPELGKKQKNQPIQVTQDTKRSVTKNRNGDLQENLAFIKIEIFLDEEKPDFFIISEHGLEKEKLQMTKLQNYTLIDSYERVNMRLGGVAI
ncbi:hypothetical protein J6590_066420 [Homalodisca vitripennis]|nr:hypothetical protein J6590_066420 [Homalodisca vitripennis]